MTIGGIMSEETLKIRVSQEGSDRVVSLEGEIQLETVSPLIKTLRQAADTGDAVVVDMTKVSYLDSQGVRALRIAYQQAASAGGMLRIRGCQGMADRVLRMVGIDRVIPME
jgi:anti-anti-sigma factor